MGIAYDPPSGVLPELRRSMQRLFRAYEPLSMKEQPLADVFLFEDVMVNAIYADALRGLARVVRESGGDARIADDLESRRRATTRALVDKCWDPSAGVFWDLSDVREEQVKVLTFSCLFPLILPDLDRTIANVPPKTPIGPVDIVNGNAECRMMDDERTAGTRPASCHSSFRIHHQSTSRRMSASTLDRSVMNRAPSAPSITR